MHDINDAYKKGHDAFVAKLEPFIPEYQAENKSDSQLVLAKWIAESDSALGMKHVLSEKDILKSFKAGDMIWFSIINLPMAKIDNEFYEGRNQEFYIPYLYAMFLVVDDTVIDFIHQNEKTILASIKKGIPCRLSKLNEGENINNGIDATVIFAASPFKGNAVTLYFNISPTNSSEREELKRLKEESKKLHDLVDDEWNVIKEYIYHESPEVYHTIQNCSANRFLPDSETFGYIKIYNVGQGFCGYIRGRKKKRMLVDIGMDQRYFRKYSLNKAQSLPLSDKRIITRNYRYINQTKPHIVFLTHWDIDHLFGISLVDGTKFPDIWIAPSVVETKRHQWFLCRLLAYLHRNRYTLIMIGENFNGDEVWDNGFLTIYKGKTGMKGRKSDNRKYNDQGLILTIKNDIIFPGDCAYVAWPQKLKIPKHEYSVLMAAHHGGEAGIPQNLSECNNFSTTKHNKIAVFSYGIHNKHKHPYSEHVQYLERLGYEPYHMINYAAIFIGLKSDLINLPLIIEDENYRYFYIDEHGRRQQLEDKVTDCRIRGLIKSKME